MSFDQTIQCAGTGEEVLDARGYGNCDSDCLCNSYVADPLCLCHVCALAREIQGNADVGSERQNLRVESQ